MKYITLIASETINGAKVEVAKQENFPIAESLADIAAMENEDKGWNLEEILSAFNGGSRVKRQTQLRADAKVPSTTNVKIFKNMSEAEQTAMLQKHGLI